MMRPRRAMLLVAFSLLTSAATVYAECAWVLWNYEFVVGEEVYSVDSGHPSLSDCEQGLKTYAATLKRVGYAVTGGGYVPGTQRVIGNKGNKRTDYLCLPDTGDPRGPKGK